MRATSRPRTPTRTLLFLALGLGAAPLAAGCMHGEPDTYVSDLDPECAGTELGQACMILQFSATPILLQRAQPGALARLKWALYSGGDVDLFGPGEHLPLYEGILEEVDLTLPAGTYRVVLANVPAQAYQALAYLDKNGDGTNSTGDFVTFPSDPFRIPSDKATDVHIELDYLR